MSVRHWARALTIVCCATAGLSARVGWGDAITDAVSRIEPIKNTPPILQGNTPAAKKVSAAYSQKSPATTTQQTVITPGPTQQPAASAAAVEKPERCDATLFATYKTCMHSDLTGENCKRPTGCDKDPELISFDADIRAIHTKIENSLDKSQKRSTTSDLKGNSDDQVASEDPCKYSATINGKFTCQGTETVVTGAKLANAVSQAAGSAYVNYQGQQQMQLAAQQNTQSAAMEAAAEVQANGAKTQLAIGALNTALGLVQLQKSFSHSKNAKTILAEAGQVTKVESENKKEAQATHEGVDGYVKGNSGVASDIVKNFELNSGDKQALTVVKNNKGVEDAAGSPALIAAKALLAEKQADQRADEVAAREKRIRSEASRIGRVASGEQAVQAEKAMSGGMLSLITGGQQLVSGYFGQKAAEAMKNAANTLKATPTPGMNMNPTPYQPAMPGTAVGANTLRSDSLLDGVAVAPSPTMDEAKAEDDKALPPGDLGPLGNPAGLNNDMAAGPGAGNFQGGPGALSVPGGGGGGGGGGSTAPYQGGDDKPKAQYVARREASDSYQGAGAYAPTAAGGAAGNNPGSSPDLAKMLDQFLPKNEDLKNKNGILDFGGRGPAGAEGSFSVLDKNTNIFDRLSRTYQEKQQGGVVGAY